MRVSKMARLALNLTRTALGFGLVVASMGGVAFALVDSPEIDAGSAVSALALLSGGMMLLKDRFRSK